MKSKKYRVFVSTIIAMGLMLVMSDDITSDSVLSILCGSPDIEVSDFYNRVIGGTKNKSLDENIVIVNIDSLVERKDLAELIQQVNACAPRLIAVDVIFEEHKDSIGDLLLMNTLRDTKNLLMAQALNPYTMIPEQDLITEEFPKALRGIINLTENVRYGIIRDFTPFFGMEEEYMSFPCAIVDMVKPDVIDKVKKRDKDEETIFFSPTEFYVIDPSNIANNMVSLKDKIVLIGTVTDPLDLHRTPIDDDYPGIMLQAQAVSMLLHNKLIREFSDVINWILAIVSCLLMTCIYVYMDTSNMQNIGSRIVPILWMLLIVWIGCYAFSHWQIYLDAPKTLLLSAFAALVIDFWIALGGIMEYMCKFRTKKE